MDSDDHLSTTQKPNPLASPLAIRDLLVDGRGVLAPLAGVSDVPFRRICRELGAALTYVEMLSATALCYGNRKTFAMLARHESERQLGVQVTGRTAEEVARAVSILDREGFDTIDLNMGCPVKKVVQAGCGSAILKDPQRVEATLQAARAATSRPLSAKIRLGYTRETVNVADISSLVARHADMLTIHGRTRSESYEHGVDLEGISKGVQAARAINPKVAVLSNGDVFAHSDAERHLTVTASDGVMVSRGALGNPWIFSSLRSGQEVFPSVCEWQEVVLRHIDYQREFFGDTPVAAVLMRKHLLWYSKGFAGSKKFREKLGQVSDLAEARAAIRDFALQIPADSRRFDGKRHLTDATEQQSSDPKWEMDRTYDRGVGTEGLEA